MSSSDYRSPWGNSPFEMKRKNPAGNKYKPRRQSPWPAVFILATLVLVGAGLWMVYAYLFATDGVRVGMSFVGPKRVSVGEPFIVEVSISNVSEEILKNSKISLFLPEDIHFLGQSSGQRVVEQVLGDVGPGSANQREFELIAVGGSGFLKRFRAAFYYTTAGSPNAQFEEVSETDIFIGESAINLSIDAPEKVFNGENFDIKISYANNTGKEFQGTALKVDYPPSFTFKRSTMQTSLGSNNLWDLGTLSAGSSGELTVTGSIVGPDGSFFNINGSVSADFLGRSYAISSQTANVSISQSPLSLNINLNGMSDYVAGLGDPLSYTINYRNNSNIVMQNVIIRAKLTGELFDFTNFSTNASFSSLNNTITWIAANTPALLNVAPGQSGSVVFRIPLARSFPIRLPSDKNYTIKVDAEIESLSVPSGTGAEKTISVASINNKIQGRIVVQSEAYWRDASSGILNAGPYPPVVNQPTQYTIHWRVSNYAADFENVTVSAFLQSGTVLTGKIKSNIDSVPTYNPSSGLVTWSLGNIPANRGVVSEAPEAIFQVEATPAINQIGKSIVLLGETRALGTDSFTGRVLESGAPALDTLLPYDKTVVDNRTVQP